MRTSGAAQINLNQRYSTVEEEIRMVFGVIYFNTTSSNLIVTVIFS